ncbi:low molecular weight protein arginine phosphatase [Gorillibacterium sp. sgz5001074]|uniref:low molecular weight protein arginine phosphatase n=1 Tax=Gorillibacterium sp. sgz5001074 TaxID=3446695 RepID=UPI003F66A6FE
MKTRILFVCTGNTCRSPMAEGLCRSMAEREGLEVEVRSAGVSAVDGAAVSRHTGDILREKGASGGVTSSSSLKPETVRWADLILTMTMSHKRMLLERHPEAVDKVHTLLEYAESDPAVLDRIREKESLLSELQLKQALGQPIGREERERLYRLDEAAPDFDIPDPFGGSRRDYDETAKAIERALASVLKRLKRG